MVRVLKDETRILSESRGQLPRCLAVGRVRFRAVAGKTILFFKRRRVLICPRICRFFGSCVHKCLQQWLGSAYFDRQDLFEQLGLKGK
jgi:hypothetical protein